VTAERGYGDASGDDDLHELGVRNVVMPRKGQTQQGPASRGTTSTVPPAREMANRCEGRISTLKRGYGWTEP
jgi:transposase, IS5 family